MAVFGERHRHDGILDAQVQALVQSPRFTAWQPSGCEVGSWLATFDAVKPPRSAFAFTRSGGLPAHRRVRDRALRSAIPPAELTALQGRTRRMPFAPGKRSPLWGEVGFEDSSATGGAARSRRSSDRAQRQLAIVSPKWDSLDSREAVAGGRHRAVAARAGGRFRGGKGGAIWPSEPRRLPPRQAARSSSGVPWPQRAMEGKCGWPNSRVAAFLHQADGAWVRPGWGGRRRPCAACSRSQVDGRACRRRNGGRGGSVTDAIGCVGNLPAWCKGIEVVRRSCLTMDAGRRSSTP